MHHYAKSCQTVTPPLTLFAYLFTGVKVEETGKIGRKRWDDGLILSCTQIHIVVPLCFFSVPLLTFWPILGDASHLLGPELILSGAFGTIFITFAKEVMFSSFQLQISYLHPWHVEHCANDEKYCCKECDLPHKKCMYYCVLI